MQEGENGSHVSVCKYTSYLKIKKIQETVELALHDNLHWPRIC